MSHIRRYPTPAHTYYVDATNGLDANRGSEDAPFQTVTKINALSLKPGDRVLFKRGETFAGRLYPTVSGSPSRRVVFGAYGSGNLPIVDGSASDEGALRIQSPTNYLRFENIDFSGSSDADYYCTVNCYTDNVCFYNCVFRDAASTHGFSAFAQEAAGGTIHHLVLDSCIARDNHMCGITIGSVDGTLGPHDNLVYNCTAYNNGTTAWADHGIYVRHGAIVDSCTCYSNPVGAGVKVNDQGVNDSPFAPIIRNCTCYDNFIGIILDNVRTLVYNNLIYRNTFCAIQTGTESDDCLVYFNTFINSYSVAVNYSHIKFDHVTSAVTFRNNLFIQDIAIDDRTVLWMTNPTEQTLSALVAANDFDYDIYYYDGNVAHKIGKDTSDRTWADWQGYGAEVNGTILTALPDLVNRYDDYHPADGGNLKGLGIAIAGYGQDKDGNARADPPTPGCYEEAAA